MFAAARSRHCDFRGNVFGVHRPFSGALVRFRFASSGRHRDAADPSPAPRNATDNVTSSPGTDACALAEIFLALAAPAVHSGEKDSISTPVNCTYAYHQHVHAAD
ncbi:hCG1788049 [Anopheles sinensis]|uniref:HCG1788049 n=1 Tax=Anopheles sinensis TaxID=74873 RepID=A0A084WKZ4_ANOSI|nr:hCG1788049 [Anopheles sinensis]